MTSDGSLWIWGYDLNSPYESLYIPRPVSAAWSVFLLSPQAVQEFFDLHGARTSMSCQEAFLFEAFRRVFAVA